MNLSCFNPFEFFYYLNILFKTSSFLKKLKKEGLIESKENNFLFRLIKIDIDRNFGEYSCYYPCPIQVEKDIRRTYRYQLLEELYKTGKINGLVFETAKRGIKYDLAVIELIKRSKYKEREIIDIFYNLMSLGIQVKVDDDFLDLFISHHFIYPSNNIEWFGEFETFKNVARIKPVNYLEEYEKALNKFCSKSPD